MPSEWSQWKQELVASACTGKHLSGGCRAPAATSGSSHKGPVPLFLSLMTGHPVVVSLGRSLRGITPKCMGDGSTMNCLGALSAPHSWHQQ